MMERVLALENLAKAWKRVKANKGAPGVDGMIIEAFPAFCRNHWLRIRQALMDGTYRPAPVRRVFIPKPDGSLRPLGVPTVLDRVIQQALAQVIGPLFESGFHEYSYGIPVILDDAGSVMDYGPGLSDVLTRLGWSRREFAERCGYKGPRSVEKFWQGAVPPATTLNILGAELERREASEQ